MSDGSLPDPDSPGYRILLLRGRQTALREAFEALSDDDIDPDAPIEEVALQYARARTAYGDWLWSQLEELKIELRLVGDELGLGDLPHESDD